MATKDGGPAFSRAGVFSVDHAYADQGEAGMSLRDYFAIHADQPGVAEIVAEAGLVHNAYGIWSGPETRVAAHFNAWWETVPQAEKFRLYAVVRYRMADAMLAAREAHHD